jgi:penicillin-binding protein 1C
MKLRRLRWSRWSAIAAIAVVALGAIAIVLAMAPMDTAPYLKSLSSGELLDRNGRVMYAFLNEKGQWCFERSFDELGPRLIDATLAAEDQRFYRHFGVDPVAVARALWQNVRHARVVSGGSTITMQVVKLYRGSSHSVSGKAAQALQAVRLERCVDKEAILNAYLNGAPYGLNLVGAEAASLRYFGKPARELTLSEAALIAALPKAPTRLMPLDHPEAALARRNYVLRRMREDGHITDGECRNALKEPLGAKWHEFPALAPHLAMLLKSDVLRQGRLAVTLDTEVQRSVEGVVARYMRRYRGDISNASVIVADASSASVLARVGSVDFFNTPGGGQVDACRVRRSPGSSLKPFTYALAMEQNVLYASETLLDDSLDFGTYNPKNYDGEYNGLISAADALRHSLNVPAVMVLDRLGTGALHKFLQGCGLSTLIRTPEEYGLGLTLGDCEVRLDEMTAAYCMLTNLGVYRPLEVVAENGVAVPQRRCLSRGTCLKVFEMLEQPLPDELEPNLIRANTPPRACWKTGTSTGHHDAWAFVFNRQYVVGVWMGNNSGRPSNRLVGMLSALPLAARVFRALPPSSMTSWPDPKDDLRDIRVCAVSGLPASKWCERTRDVLLPRTQYVNRICDVHYPSDESDRSDRSDRSDASAPRVSERWPGSPKGWDLAKVGASGKGRTVEAANAQRRANLLIREPANSGEYVLTGERDGDRVRLRTSLDGVTTLYWYLDERFLGLSSPDQPLMMDLRPGSHTLACMTKEGALDKVSFNVSEPEARLQFAKQ